MSLSQEVGCRCYYCYYAPYHRQRPPCCEQQQADYTTIQHSEGCNADAAFYDRLKQAGEEAWLVWQKEGQA